MPVTLNGVASRPRRVRRTAGVLTCGLRPDNELVVDAAMAYSHDGEGLHRHVDPADGRTYLYAMSFLDAAPRWFACFDQPDLKAPVTIDVRCPPDWTVAGQRPGDCGRARRSGTSSRRTVRHVLHHAGRRAVPLGARRARRHPARAARPRRHWPSTSTGTPRSCSSTPAVLRRAAPSCSACRYPWGEYHQAFVPDFNAGAMENPGCVTLPRHAWCSAPRSPTPNASDRDNVIAHEMAHMWFGDLVTMRWWDDLWLNESFAEYLGASGVRDPGRTGRVGASSASSRKAWGYAADHRPSTHPVAGNGAPDAATALTDFDGISYAKGASVLRQLAAWLGDERVPGRTARPLRRARVRQRELADLLAAWTRAGAVDLDGWAQPGCARLGSTRCVMDGPDGLTPTRHRRQTTRARRDARDHARRGRVNGARAGGRGRDHGAADPGSRSPTRATRPGRRSRCRRRRGRTMASVLPGLDPLARVVVWNALQLAVADAEVDPSLAVSIVAAAVPARGRATRC